MVAYDTGVAAGYADGDGYRRVDAEDFVADCVEVGEAVDLRSGDTRVGAARVGDASADFFTQACLHVWVFAEHADCPGES